MENQEMQAGTATIKVVGVGGGGGLCAAESQLFLNPLPPGGGNEFPGILVSGSGGGE